MVAYASVIDGPWANQPTWGGVGPPGDGDTATINNTVYVDSDVTVGTGAGTAITITTGGRLRWPVAPAGNWTLNIKGNVNVLNGGIFEVGNETERIPVANTATVIFNMANAMLSIAATGGTFKAYGAQNYHCASEAFQRTTLSAGVAAGLHTVTMSDAADYQSTDVVWVGGYAGKDTAVTNVVIEKVTITRVSTTQFTATFAHAHDAGDFLVNSARNVIIKSKSATDGFSINGTFAATHNVYMQADWVYFGGIGYGNTTRQNKGFSIQHTNTTETNQVPAGRFLCTNCCFDAQSGNRYTIPIYIEMYTTLADTNVAFKNIHFYSGDTASGWNYLIELNALTISGYPGFGIGAWQFDNVTAFVTSGYPLAVFYALDQNSSWIINADATWYCGYYYGGTLFGYGNKWIGTFSNAKIYGLASFFISASASYPGYQTHADCVISDMTYYHGSSSSGSIWITLDNAEQQRRYILKNCTFYDHVCTALGLWPSSDIIMDNCSFDKCNTQAGTGGDDLGAILIGANSSSYIRNGFISLYNCTFGTVTVNNKSNILFGLTSATPGDPYCAMQHHRIILNKCTFKQPASFAWRGVASSSWTNTMGWAVRDSMRSMTDWRYRDRWGANFTVEFCDCIVKDSGGTDQWPITYPNVYRLGVVTGGSEIRMETSTIIDSSYALKILPHNATVRCHVTRPCPIKISATSGKTVTIKLSLQKNQSQTAGRRPQIHLYGLGIDTYTEMSDVIGSWEELTVSGVTTETGTLDFWVSVINEPDNTISFNPDAINSPKALGWLVIYADGLKTTVV